METAATCRVCGQQGPRPVWEHDTATLVSCDACGAQFWWPLRCPGAEWYARHGSTSLDWEDSLMRAGHRRFLSKPPVLHGSLLDVGCGHGLFLDRVRTRYGLEVWGLDWDPQAVQVGREVRGLTHLSTRSMQEFATSLGTRRFDAVTVFEVVEHQEDPVLFLRQASGVLRAGGTLAGSVPNRDRLVIGARESWDYPPHHLFWFDRRSLARLLQEAGLQDIRITALCERRLVSEQILARFSFGLASKIVSMPANRSAQLKQGENVSRTALQGLPRPLGYRITTALKRLGLAPMIVPVAAYLALNPSRRHTLYFEATRPRGACARGGHGTA